MKTLLLAFLTLCCGLIGCIDNHSSIVLTAPCAFPDGCAFTSGGCSEKLLSKTWVDVSATDQFVLYIEVDNQLKDNKSDVKPNTNDAWVEQYEVEYSAPGGSVPTGRTDVLYGPIPADGASVIKAWIIIPGSGSAAAIAGLIPASIGALDVVAHFVARGHYVDGTSFETAPLEVAFTACSGCFNSACTLSCPPSPTPYGDLAQIGLCL